jgi:hypothetical protein
MTDPPAPDSPSGVLARLTSGTLSFSVSLVSLACLDLSGDGNSDIGPIPTSLTGHGIADSDSDTHFDGPPADARIVEARPARRRQRLSPPLCLPPR